MSKKNTGVLDSYLVKDLAGLGTKTLLTNYSAYKFTASHDGFVTVTCSFIVAPLAVNQCGFRMVLVEGAVLTPIESTLVLATENEDYVSGSASFQVKSGGVYGLDLISTGETPVVDGTVVFHIL